MRIAGGTARGRVVKAPKGVELRPTEERVRQAFFNILGPAIEGASFLDLFCGSGAVGLEAWSRGAGELAFVDAEKRCLDSARNHWLEFGFPPDRARFERGSVDRALGALQSKGYRLQFAYVDPPYGSEAGPQALRLLGELDILVVGAPVRIAFEHEKRQQVPESFGRLAFQRRYDYGNTSLSFFAPHDAD